MRRVVALLIACKSPAASTPDATSPDAAAGSASIAITVDSTRFVAREHFLASGEMQISGEPLAEIMGRDLGGYSRDLVPPDIYNDPTTHLFWTDPAGFSTAIESYEYSKQPMNAVAFELGAGTPLPNAQALVQKYAHASNAHGKWVFAPGTFPANNPSGDVNPHAVGVAANNPLGWPGILPTVHVFASFDPAIDPTDTADLSCSIVSDDNPNEPTAPLIGADYECDATTLHLRTAPDPVISPGADGFATWKYGLWVMNYLQVMHDDANAPVESVPEDQLASVGSGRTYLGSSDIEGFQAQLLIAEIDARAKDWLANLSTDGTTLGAFPAPLAYDYAQPLHWFGATAGAAIEPLDLIGLAIGYATVYALTDRGNRDVGGSQPCRAVFDGDPFPADNGLADGEDTLHDRALAIMRVAVIDLDRMATPSTVDTTTAAYAVIGLRTVLRALGSQLELYSNNTPDTAIAATPLDAQPIRYPSDATLTFTARTKQLLRAYADVLYALEPTTLDTHTAVVRGLFAAYLATGDVKYRDRAIAVFDHMDATFYDPVARLYTDSGDTMTYTPVRFALLQSSLRDMYELVATRPGSDRAPELEARLARLNKLVLDGWDDRDRDKIVAWPDECANVVDGLPRGGLQMAERTLSGEIGRLRDEGSGSGGPPTSDRDQDCVPEIDDAHLPAALAESITLRVTRR